MELFFITFAVIVAIPVAFLVVGLVLFGLEEVWAYVYEKLSSKS